MKTDELIKALAADTTPVERGAVARAIAVNAAVVAVLAFGLLASWLGVRSDLGAAILTSAFWMKATYTAALAVGGFVLVERLSRPGVQAKSGLIVIGASFAVIAVIAALQLAQTAPDQMKALTLGSSWDRCPFRILALSAPGFVATIIAMRRLAPTNLRLAGAAAGLFSSAIAATIYGLYCQETAASFVAIFYSLGIAGAALIGALLGPLTLRWR